jgi:hypothetical protein
MSEEKKLLQHMELFNIITTSGLTPNQYYLICCLKDGISALKINHHLEIRYLINNEWIDATYKLQPKSFILIKKVESLFVSKKELTLKQTVGTNYKKNIEQYRLLFPAKKLDTGRFARSSIKNLEKLFKWFFENYDYKWETVIAATEHYVNECENKNWKFVQCSQYFIRKNNSSQLADYCDMIIEGIDDNLDNHQIKVV